MARLALVAPASRVWLAALRWLPPSRRRVPWASGTQRRRRRVHVSGDERVVPVGRILGSPLARLSGLGWGADLEEQPQVHVFCRLPHAARLDHRGNLEQASPLPAGSSLTPFDHL